VKQFSEIGVDVTLLEGTSTPTLYFLPYLPKHKMRIFFPNLSSEKWGITFFDT
jgi:hypothetical protein